jgi:flagellar L-ring protein precursor FlgH
MRAVRYVALLLGALALAGCQSAPRRDPAYAPVVPMPQPAPVARDGAIFHAAHEVALFSDNRARRAGDILTIRLVERTNAIKSAESTVAQETAVQMANPTLFGHQLRYDLPVHLPLAGRQDGLTLGTNLNSTKDFDGKGDAAQSNQLTGDITVSVAQVLPNGNLVVQGEKVLTLNRGNEYLRLSGIVRPEDVRADNTVLSSQVANATIAYSGDGQVADASTMGWLARFFISALVPF